MSRLKAAECDPSPPAIPSSADRLRACATQLEADGLCDAAEQALVAARLCDDGPDSTLALADLLVRQERAAEAIALYESVLRQRQLDDAQRSGLAHNLAVALRERGEFERACGWQAESLRRQLSVSGELTPEDLGIEACEAIRRGDYPLAENLLLRSLTMEKLRDNAGGMAGDCGNLGVLALLRGDAAVAIRFLSRAYHLHLAVRDRRGAVADLLNLADVFSSLARWSLSRRCMSRALHLSEAAGLKQSRKRVLERLAELDRVDRFNQHEPEWN